VTAIRCVVFDLDDTLFLERDYVRSGFLAVGRWAADALGIADFASRAWAELESGRRGDIFDRVLAATGRPYDRQAVQAMVSIYRDHVPSLSLLDDARACLTHLSGKAVLACVTDGPLASQRAKAQVLDLGRWFDPVVFTAALGPGFGKPHPRAFQIIEAATGSSGRACAYIADNPAKDFGGPASLGWRTVRVVRRGGLHSTLRSGGDVEMELPDLTSLPEALGFLR
jgi:putative hydrolase of the HAD superfamily